MKICEVTCEGSNVINIAAGLFRSIYELAERYSLIYLEVHGVPMFFA
jgi:hypothetical protein